VPAQMNIAAITASVNTKRFLFFIFFSWLKYFRGLSPVQWPGP
jgi:hypothetical protein